MTRVTKVRHNHPVCPRHDYVFNRGILATGWRLVQCDLCRREGLWETWKPCRLPSTTQWRRME